VIKVSVLYPNTAGARFDMAYYVNRHMPMVSEKLGAALEGMNVEEGLSGVEPGSPPAYLALWSSAARFGRGISGRLRAARAGHPQRRAELHEHAADGANQPSTNVAGSW
jgi:uncharacterized protein (TIGR02118 family)